MFNMLCSKKGISLIEVCIALFLLGFGILALISLQPSAWRLSGKSDYLGRASGILAAQLQATEAQIMNPNNAMPTSDPEPVPVYVSGQGKGTAKQGDVTFSVTRTITDLGNNASLVNVRVTWSGNDTGIRESMIVVRQQSFAQ